MGANFSPTDHACGRVMRAGAACDPNCQNADLTDANLYGADLTDANLYGANLTGADLVNANLSGATLTNWNYENGAFFENTTCPDGTVTSDFC